MERYTDFLDEWKIDSNQTGFHRYEEKGRYTKMHWISILDEENPFSKPAGDYISISFDALEEDACIDALRQELSKVLSLLFPLEKASRVLVAGIGNHGVIADSLGPQCASLIEVNAAFETRSDVIRCASIVPGVLGNTGLESADIIKGVVNVFHPDLVIIIDALATSSLQRINRVIQICNTSISPGSGVNHGRQVLDEAYLGVPVIVIGVATIISTCSIANHSKIPHQMMTPKTIDVDLKLLSSVIADGLNDYFYLRSA